MLAPLYEEHQDAVSPAWMAREALERIRLKMAEQQTGEAFDDMPELPVILKRTKRDDEKARKWYEAHPEVPAQETAKFGGRKEHRYDPEFEKLLIANAREERLRLTGKANEDDEPADRKAKALARRARADAGAPAKPAGEQYWDTSACRWRPIGYMSPAKYARLIAEMPDARHKAAFIEMFGHTQAEGARNPPSKVLETRRKAAREAVRASAPPKRAAVAKTAKARRAPAAGPAKARGQNPEHLAKVTALLTRPEGATLAEIGAAMGWQEHSASAFLSGIRKTRTITKTVNASVGIGAAVLQPRGNVYRLEDTP